MNCFYVITNRLKDTDFRITNEIKSYIEQCQGTCILAQKDQEGDIIPGTVPKDAECAIVLGGDGSLIRAARNLKGYDIPILGVNLGTLGYLTEVEPADCPRALERLIREEVTVETRMMIEGSVNGHASNVSMNDIVVTRSGSLRVIHFDIYVNGVMLNSYRADGVIISTPTGTTGYNLSAGGPIVEPTAQMLVITPICSHALNTSSIVLSAEDQIEVVICEGRYGRQEQASVTFDGLVTLPVVTGDRVVIRKSPDTTRLVRLNTESFMKIMREKMKGN